MLYFEDFMEDIEDLPYEFKENLTAIRQLDLQVQNIMDPLDGHINDFFHKCSQNTFSSSQSDQEYEKILKEFDQVDEKNVEKIKITDQMKETFNKMIKKLDTELGKFKLELEADNPGSAESIERMVNQQIKSGVSDGIQRFDRKRIKRGRMGYDISNRSQLNVRKLLRSVEPQPEIINLKVEKSESLSQSSLTNHHISSVGGGQNDALMTTAVANGSLSPASSLMGSLNTPRSKKRKFDWRSNQGSISHIDKSVKLERRHKVMSAMSDDSESNLGTNDELGMDEGVNTSLFDHHTTTSSSVTTSTINNNNNNNNNNNTNNNDIEVVMRRGGGGGMLSDGMLSDGSGYTGRTPASLNFGMSYVGSGGSDCLLSSGGGGGMLTVSGNSVTVSDNNQLDIDDVLVDTEQNEEPRYCFCNDISYGDMIACDSPQCRREWFHYGCVNLTVAPKGSWFCRDCKVKNRQRR